MFKNRSGFESCCFWIFLIAFTVCLSVIVSAATITVNDLNDNTTSGDTFCTLREAINNAHSDSDTTSGDCAAGSGADTIKFSVSGTIVLGSTFEINDLDPYALTIDGAGQNIALSGNATVGVMLVNAGTTLNVNELTIQHGHDSSGGGIQNFGTMSVSNCTFSGNSASIGGGGIINRGTMSVSNCTFSGNSASIDGGGILSFGTLSVTNCTFSGNSAGFSGGGIQTLTSTLNVTNSTFSGNHAGTTGGGIDSNLTTLNVTNSTFSGNSGGGINNSLASILSLRNTIIANNSGGDCVNFGSAIATNTRNLIGDGSCSPALTGDPQLDPLADNGGPTQTFALQSTSPAIDAGDERTCKNAPVNNRDQRGYLRPIDGDSSGTATCDIGAFEYGSQVAVSCPNGQGYWKNNPGAWPVVLLTLGVHQYTKDQLLPLLKLPDKTVKNDASLTLADQLIAAKLNVASGADAAPVQQMIIDADNLLDDFEGAFPSGLPYNVRPKSIIGQQMVALALQLEQYNKRLLTPNCQ